MKKLVTRSALLLFVSLGLSLAGVSRAEALPLVRDAEVENIIRAYVAPLLNVAGLESEAVKIFLVNDDSLNAFVAGGMNLFIHTGLLARSEGPEGVIGVLSHEIGHIAGGHLVRTTEALRGASIETLLVFLLGAAVAISGAPDAGTAIIVGGTGIAQQTIIRYSQAQEQAADQAALGYLEATGQSARGLLALLETLRDQELLVADRRSPYARTHPLTVDRVLHVRAHVENSAFSDAPARPEYVEMHARMLAKLNGFLDPPGHTLAKYSEDDNSLPARYARAIAYYRIPDLERALAEIDTLIAEYPDDPYFHELKGQMLFENGHLNEAIAPFERAIALMPDEALFRLGLAQAQIETNDPALNDAALGHLKIAVSRDRMDSTLWHYLGIAYGRQGKYGQSSLALAEEALLQRRSEDVAFHAGRAERYLGEGSPEWLRLQDLKRVAEQLAERG